MFWNQEENMRTIQNDQDSNQQTDDALVLTPQNTGTNLSGQEIKHVD